MTGHQDSRSLSQERYGRFAQAYVTSATHAKGADLDRLVEIAQPQPHWKVLDVATGGGHTALRFAPLIEHVTATDITSAMLAVARTFILGRGVENVLFACADAQDLPFEARAFDLVTCRIAPHHFADCARFLREGARVLKPGGLLLVQDHVLPEDQTPARYIDAFERLRDPSHNRAFAESEWIKLFQEAGLEVKHSEQLVKQHVFLSWAARQECTGEVIERLIDMVRQAPHVVLEWMQPRDFGTPKATFVNQHVIISGYRT